MTIEELRAKIGEHLATSDWFLMDQQRIDHFADTTEDHQFIHVDPEAARMTPFGTTIAHGFLTLSMLAPAVLVVEQPATRMAVNYGFDKVRFLSPVKSGSRIRCHFKLLGLVEKRPGQWQETLEVTAEIEGEEKPALIAEWLIQLFT